MMVEAKSRGFEVVLIYIGTESVEINLARIKNRVLQGGHDVPEKDVRRRYQRSFRNLPIALGARRSHDPVRQLDGRGIQTLIGEAVVRTNSRLGRQPFVDSSA
jgi:hypothetical protein